MEYVYVLEFPDFVKIGYSTRIDSRIKQVEAMVGHKATNIYYTEATRDTENAMHSFFKTRRVKGEFFSVPFNEAKETLFNVIHNPERYKPTKKPTKYTEKSKEYTMAYMKEKLDEIKFRVPKGQKDLYRQHAEKMGEKMTPFIIRAIGEAMARDNGASPVGTPSETGQTLTEAKRMVRAAGELILPSLLRESVAEASRAAGETDDAFLWRAVSGQAEQDREKRKAAVNAADAPQGILIPVVVLCPWTNWNAYRRRQRRRERASQTLSAALLRHRPHGNRRAY